MASAQAAVDRSRRSVEERESLVAAHVRLAEKVDAVLRRRHQALSERESELRRREEAFEKRSLVETGPSLPPEQRATSPAVPSEPGVSPVAEGQRTEPQAVATPVPSQLGPRRHPNAGRLPSGNPRLDDLLLGGLPPRSHIALVGDAFVGKEVVLYGFIAEGLRRNEPVVIVTTTRPSQEVSRAVRAVVPQLDAEERAGRVAWVDASGAGVASHPHRFAPKGPDDLAGLTQALTQASRHCVAVSPTGRFRVGFLGLSAVLVHNPERESLAAMQNVLSVLRSHEALTMYSVEAEGVHDPRAESLLGRMDGALLFRQDRGKTMLAAKGFGGVATSDWIECQMTEHGLSLGSFALERIR